MLARSLSAQLPGQEPEQTWVHLTVLTAKQTKDLALDSQARHRLAKQAGLTETLAGAVKLSESHPVRRIQGACSQDQSATVLP